MQSPPQLPVSGFTPQGAGGAPHPQTDCPDAVLVTWQTSPGVGQAPPQTPALSGGPPHGAGWQVHCFVIESIRHTPPFVHAPPQIGLPLAPQSVGNLLAGMQTFVGW